MNKLIFIVSLVLSVQGFSDYVKDFRNFNIGIIPINAEKNLQDKGAVPPFIAETLEGKKFTNTDIKVPSIIVFWSVGCPSCKAPLLGLNSLEEKIAKNKIKVNLMTVSNDPSQLVMEYFSKNKISLDTVVDKNGSFFKAFGAIATPYFYIVDSQRFVRGIIPGATDVGSESFWKLIQYISKNKKFELSTASN